MKEFLIENYSWIISLASIVVMVLVAIFKKVKIIKTDTAFEEVLSELPSFIVKAEKSLTGGANKKAFVMSMALHFLSTLTGEKDQNKIYGEYGSRISDAIEAILLTPIKKEVVDEDKK